MVARSRSMMASESQRPQVIEIMAAPASTQHKKGRIEAIWNMGRGAQNRSFSPKKNRDRFIFCPLRTNMDWCIGQPFGSAVVPDVYIMMQIIALNALKGCLNLVVAHLLALIKKIPPINETLLGFPCRMHWRRRVSSKR